MNNDIKKLKQEFKKIKEMGLIKSLRKGSTGLGYTFESLLNKKEDQECKPDFNSIELKCKLAYSKNDLTLFNCIPTRHNESAINYIFERYGHYRYGNTSDYKLFERKIFVNYAIKRFGYTFKLKVDYYRAVIILKAYYNDNFIEDICVWDFKVLERKLKRKLTNLAIIQAYPYRRKDQLYYKYVKMDLYKLSGFFEFLQLIEDDKVFIRFYIKNAIGDNQKNIIEDHGVAFKIKNECIEELFFKIRH